VATRTVDQAAQAERADPADPTGPAQAGNPADPRDVAGAGDLDAFLISPLARVVLARARLRAVMPLDTVTFVAACPACGRDCDWTQERQETRLRSTIMCECVEG